MPLPNDWKEFIECLNAERVDYLLVGGHAVAYHGLPRLTKDLDFFVRNTRENAERIVSALHAFGFASLSVKAEDFLAPGAFIMLGHPPNRIDLVTAIDGVDFEEAWQGRLESDFEGLPVSVISKECLIRNKLAAGRPQDLADAARLEKLDSN